jgi:acyl-CoA hydrolase
MESTLIFGEDRESGIKTKANEGNLHFVAVDDTGRPVEVPQVVPETELEIEALKRL